jgi:L-methionine (R)-S-oxide reductase
MGQVACQVIPFGRGVCGMAAQSRVTQVVGDVHAFPGHIACDGLSRSEVVVPILDQGGKVCWVVFLWMGIGRGRGVEI